MKVLTGKQKKPRRIMVYGVPGVGKSTWAASAPGVIFMPTEDGIDDLDVPHFEQPKTYEDCLACLKYLGTEEHEFKTLVVDSADWLEKLIWEHLCREHEKSSIDQVGGGFGKGYTMAAGMMAKFISLLDRLRMAKGMGIIMVAHAKAERFEDPDGDGYDRYVPKLHKSSRELIMEWCDEVLFANYKTYTREVDAGPKTITKGVGNGDRILRTTAKPSAVCKNRLGLPDEIELSWDQYAEFLKK